MNGDRAFEALLNYPLAWFAEGELGLTGSWHGFWALSALGLLAAFASVWFAWRSRQLALLDVFSLTLLRTLALVLVVFCLFQPVLLRPVDSEQRAHIAVLLDDSLSMRIADTDPSRADFIRTQFSTQGDNLRTQLERDYELALFRFGVTAEPVTGVEELNFAQAGSDLVAALDYTAQALSGLPLAGVVVVSDGGVRSDRSLSQSILRLQAADIPVHTLGLGQARFARDLEISAVNLPSKALKDTTVQAQIQIRQHGYGTRELPLTVLQDEKIIAQRTVRLSDSALQTVNLPLRMEQVGPVLLRFELPLQADETVAANNTREVFMEVLDQREKLLYVEGEPRFELKFLRRAVADVPNLQIVTLLRTGDNKFYRLGIDSPEHLQNGFPTSAEELFEYRGLIIGNVEASFFSREQQRLLVDYLARRGGGVLFLGGKRAFAEGGYADSPLAEAMPVVLDTPSTGYRREVQFLPTALGRDHALSQLDSAALPETSSDSLELWRSLPDVTVVNPLSESKPGAAVLLQAETPALLGLVYQRYGRGISVALTAQNTWVWRMHADVPVDDQRHQTFWRQLLSWLVSETPQRIEPVRGSMQVVAGAATPFPVQLFTPDYAPLSGAELALQLLGPSAQEQRLHLPESAQATGLYSASVLTAEPGLYELHLKAEQTEEDKPLQRIAYLQATATGEEYYRAELQADVLRRLSQLSGGTYFTADNAAALPRAIQTQPATASVMQHYELWNMPLLLLLILLLLSLDWAYRRWRGLP